MTRLLLTHLADRRPLWAPPPGVLERLERELPDGWRLRSLDLPADGSGDGGVTAPPELLEAVAGAEVLFCAGLDPAVLAAGRRLRWIHTVTAGVGADLLEALRERAAGESAPVLTNSAGVYGPAIAESVVAGVLYFARGFDRAMESRLAARWAPERFWSEGSPVAEVAGSRVGVVGLGGIGRAVARRLTGLGAEVRGHRSFGEGTVDGISWRSGREALIELARWADTLVLSVPGTPATAGMIDGEVLDALAASGGGEAGRGLLVNVARGRVVDGSALRSRLAEGRLRGAYLDVFEREPLPREDPLWSLPNVLITPHVSGVSPEFWRRQEALLRENWRGYLEVGPEASSDELAARLVHVVDPDRGY